MQQIVRVILPNELLGEVLQLKSDGYRLVAISCSNKDGIEISYSFDKDNDFFNLRLNIAYDVEIDSITNIYAFAFLYENEIKELFGVNIKNISIDFEGSLYKTSIKTPFNTENSALKENEDGK